jgi:hypothetical protein
MAKYRFKWWHGVLGLMGLGMVAGTVKAIAAPAGQSVSNYRGLQVVIAETGAGYYWSAQQVSGGSTIEIALGGPTWTRESAVMHAHDAIDSFIAEGGNP